MGILKGILHHWNKTSSAYDTIHPETEVAQVTDWNKGIVNTLASTGLSSLVNVLSSDSLLALLIKKVFDAMGVKYSLGQNGYVCWGALFGNVITQWGLITYNSNPNGQVITPAIAFSTYFAGVVVDRGIKWNTGGTFVGVDYVDGQVIFWPIYTGSPQTVSKNGTNYYWLIFCM